MVLAPSLCGESPFMSIADRSSVPLGADAFCLPKRIFTSSEDDDSEPADDDDEDDADAKYDDEERTWRTLPLQNVRQRGVGMSTRQIDKGAARLQSCRRKGIASNEGRSEQ